MPAKPATEKNKKLAAAMETRPDVQVRLLINRFLINPFQLIQIVTVMCVCLACTVRRKASWTRIATWLE